MAVEKIALGINLRKNKISGSAGYGKYYPEVDTQKTLSLRGFAQHMVDHGSIYGRSIVEGVLLQITDCLPELVAQGVPVQLGSLGTFYPTAEVAKDAAVLNIAAMDGLNPNDIVKAIHIRFLPDYKGIPGNNGFIVVFFISPKFTITPFPGFVSGKNSFALVQSCQVIIPWNEIKASFV